MLNTDVVVCVDRQNTIMYGARPRNERCVRRRLLALIAERFRRRLQPRAPEPRPAEPSVAGRLRDYLDGRRTEQVTLHDAAQVLDRSVPHLIRSFTRSYGVSPHAYVIGARIELARKLLLDGVSPAQVAADAGFYDQAHFTRLFKRHVSVTPARYAAAIPSPVATGGFVVSR